MGQGVARGAVRPGASSAGSRRPAPGVQSGPRWLATTPESASRRTQVGGRGRLAGMGPHRLQVGGEDPVGAELALDATSPPRRRRCGTGGRGRAMARDQHAEHAVGAVDQREALLLGEVDRRQAGRGECLGGRTEPPVGVAHLALAHQRQGAVRERCEVTGAAERAVLADHRRQAVREQVGEQLGGLEPDPGVAGRQRRQPQQHQRRARPRARPRGRSPRRGSAPATALQLGAHLGGDVPGRQRPEPGRDAVRRGRRGRQGLDDRARARDRRDARRRPARPARRRGPPRPRPRPSAAPSRPPPSCRRPAARAALDHACHPTPGRSRPATLGAGVPVSDPRHG